MKRLLLLALMVAPLQSSAGPRELLQRLFDVPSVRCSVQERSKLTLGAETIASTVKVHYNGKGGVLREYIAGPATSVALLATPAGTWQRTGSEWTRLSDRDSTLVRGVDLILKNYIVTVGSPTRLLGRTVLSLNIESRYPFQPKRRVLIEESTGLRFEDRLFSPSGKLRSSTTIASFDSTPPPESLFRAPQQAQNSSSAGPTSFVSVSRSEMERLTGRSAAVPKYVPPGFVVADYGVVRSGSGRIQPAVRYFDGLASFTVFNRGRMLGRGRGRNRQAGFESNDQRSIVDRQGAFANYLIIGDISEDELWKIADSLP